jgi:MFS family permease
MSSLNQPVPDVLAGHSRSRFKSFWVLLSVELLYVSFGISFGLLQYGVPPILMSRGVDLGSMGWVIALYIPFGLTFFWAPLIDARPLPWLSYRIGWITLMQCLSSGLLAIIAFSDTSSAVTLFSLGLAVCFAVATMDLALDALAVDIIGPQHRTLAAALKVAALALGGLIGGGVLVGTFERLGWSGTFLLTAGLPIITLLPVLALTHADQPNAVISVRPSIAATLRRPGSLRQIMLLWLMTTATVSLIFFQRPILVEMGVPLSEIGWGLGTLSPIANMLAALAIAPFLSRRASMKSLVLLVSISALAAAGTVVSISDQSASAVMHWALLQGMASSALSVIIYALILKWSSKTQSATDYAVFCGSSRLLTTLSLMVIPPALKYLTWPVFYALCVGLLVVLSVLIRREVAALGDIRN